MKIKTYSLLGIFGLLSLSSCLHNDSSLGDLFSTENKHLDLFHQYHFEIDFPAGLEVSVDSVKLNHEVHFSASKGTSMFAVYSSSYTNNMYHSDSLDQIDFDLEYTQWKFAQTNLVTLGTVTPKSFAGYPGAEYKFKYQKEDKISTRRVFIVRNQVFEIIYESATTDQFSMEGEDFFNSFELYGIEQNAVPYLNLPSERELKNKPYSIEFTGETTQMVEIVDTEHGKVPYIFDMQEFGPYDPTNLSALGAGYILFPDETTHDELLSHVTMSFESIKVLDPSIKVISNVSTGDIRDIIHEQTILNEVYTYHKRYIISENYVFYLTAVSKGKMRNNSRITNFFNSFKIKEDNETLVDKFINSKFI